MEATQEKLVDLLELQKIDSTIDRLEHRRRNLPEQIELDRLEEELQQLERRAGEQQVLADDVASRQKKLDGEIEMVDLKIKSAEQRLFDGKVSNPRELSSLQAEIESLRRRKSGMEDADLEVMEEREGVDRELESLNAQAEALRATIAEVTVKRDAAVVEIDAELQKARGERLEWEKRFDQELLSFYDDVRQSKGGVGAAALVDGTCQGCHMKLAAQEVERLRTSSGILRCDECRRILVVI